MHSLTLWVLGGIASLRGEPTTPGADFRIAVLGPTTSLAIGVLSAVIAAVVDAAGANDLVVTTVGWLAGINIVLALFNLVPAAPLDGGRILRAALWAWRGDRRRAAVQAARAGQMFGYLLIGVGIASLFMPGVGGLWFVVLGWFLINAARAEETQTLVRDALGDMEVAEVMTPAPRTAPAHATVQQVLERHVMASRHSAFPLCDEEGRLVGLITLNRIRSVPPEERPHTPAEAVACSMDDVVLTNPEERLVDLLPRLNDGADGRALVVDDTGHLRGIVTAADVARALELANLHRAPEDRPAEKSTHLTHARVPQ